MAIIVEEDKGKSNIGKIVGALAILGIIGASVYYIFFAAPELVIIAPTGALSTIAPIAQVSLHPEDVINSASFQALKPGIPAPSSTGPGTVGRSNPFILP